MERPVLIRNMEKLECTIVYWSMPSSGKSDSSPIATPTFTAILWAPVMTGFSTTEGSTSTYVRMSGYLLWHIISHCEASNWRAKWAIHNHSFYCSALSFNSVDIGRNIVKHCFCYFGKSELAAKMSTSSLLCSKYQVCLSPLDWW